MYTLAVAVLFLLVLPLQFCIAIALAVLSGFPIIFRQKRVGKNGKRFVMYKFRTMVHSADRLQRQYQRQNESKGPVFKIHNDPRFTGVGRFLSHTGLDELPQLYNVIRGDMAFIGPRPLPVTEAKQLKPWMRERERVLPGIISPAVLTGRYHLDFDAWMRSDVAYVKSKSVRTDMVLFARCIPFIGRLFWRAIART